MTSSTITIVQELTQKATDAVVVRRTGFDERTALAAAAYLAGRLAGTHVLLFGEYIELYDLRSYNAWSFSDEEELKNSDVYEKVVKRAEVIAVVADKYGPVAFVLKL